MALLTRQISLPIQVTTFRSPLGIIPPGLFSSGFVNETSLRKRECRFPQMQDVFRHHDVYRRYPQSNRNAPTAQMVDPNLEAQPLSAIGEVLSDDSKNSSSGVPASRAEKSARGLPPVEVDQDSIEDAYVQFIFYCNPNIPLSTDTIELRRGFRSPPKTDGKVFDTFTLFGLIRRLETKDIDTWSQLVIEMGVEPPDAAKNQSTQKVQQFAVRLKVLTSYFLHITIILILHCIAVNSPG